MVCTKTYGLQRRLGSVPFMTVVQDAQRSQIYHVHTGVHVVDGMAEWLPGVECGFIAQHAAGAFSKCHKNN